MIRRVGCITGVCSVACAAANAAQAAAAGPAEPHGDRVLPLFPPLDGATVDVMILLILLVMTALTVFAWLPNRAARGLQLLAFALSSIALGTLLEILPGRLAVTGHAVLCSLLNLMGVVFIAQAIRAFRRLPALGALPLAALFSAAAVPYHYWLMVSDSPALRQFVVSLVHSVLLADASRSMLLPSVPSRRRVHLPLAAGLAFMSATLLLRAVLNLVVSGRRIPALAPSLDMLSSITASLTLVGVAFGMVIASNMELREDAERLAFYDPLTALPNRRLAMERLFQCETASRNSGEPFAVLYLDLDGFKPINDCYGHDAGDRILRQVSAAISRVLEPGQLLARIGGDEFIALIHPVFSRREAEELAAEIAASVRGVRNPGNLELGISCGVGIFPDDGATAHDVLRKADAAMYETKCRRDRSLRVSA